MTFGTNTRIKFLGGELIYQESGSSLEQWGTEIAGIKKRALNLKPAFEVFRDVWFQSISDLFESGGAEENWPELSPAYSNWKAQSGHSGPLMRLTDRLYDSLTSMTSDTIWQATPRTIQFGTRVPYFQYHQDGTRNLPQRRTLVLRPEAYAQLNSIIVEFVSEGTLP